MKKELESLNLNHISYSQLSLFKKSPKLYHQIYITKEREKKGGDAQGFGSLLDCLLFTPEDLKGRFVIAEKPYIGGKLGAFIEALASLENACEQDKLSGQLPFDFSSQELYENAYRKAEFKESLKNVLIDFKKPESQRYYNYYKMSLKKDNSLIYITKEDYDKATKIAKILLTHPYTHKIFTRESVSQFSIRWYHKLLPELYIDSVLDLLEINHDEKTIYVTDLKTTGEAVESFPKSIEKFDYSLQGCLYQQAVTYAIRNKLIPNSEKLQDYNMVYQIVAVETFGEFRPMVYKMSDETFFATCEEVANLLEDYKWHVTNNKWSYSRNTYERNGLITF